MQDLKIPRHAVSSSNHLNCARFRRGEPTSLYIHAEGDSIFTAWVLLRLAAGFVPRQEQGALRDSLAGRSHRKSGSAPKRPLVATSRELEPLCVHQYRCTTIEAGKVNPSTYFIHRAIHDEGNTHEWLWIPCSQHLVSSFQAHASTC
jgi:hypothetical protein